MIVPKPQIATKVTYQGRLLIYRTICRKSQVRGKRLLLVLLKGLRYILDTWLDETGNSPDKSGEPGPVGKDIRGSGYQEIRQKKTNDGSHKTDGRVLIFLFIV